MQPCHVVLNPSVSKNTGKLFVVVAATLLMLQHAHAQIDIATTGCAGQPAVLTVPQATIDSLGGEGHYTVNWYTQQFQGNPVGSGPTFTVPANSTVSNYWCEINYSANRVKCYVNYQPLPNASFTTNSPVCIPNKMTFAAIKTCNDGAFSGNGVDAGAHTSSGKYATTVQDNVTMMALVRWRGGTSGSQIIVLNGNSGANGYAIVVDAATKKLGILLGGVALLSSNAVLATNTWVPVAAVRSNGIWHLYVGGSANTITNSTATPNVPANGGFYVGYDNNDAEYFNGDIDEVMVWEQALDANLLTQYQYGCLSTIPAGLKGYWPFNETSGAQVTDASGNGKTLFLNNSANRTSSSTYQWNLASTTATGLNTSYLYSTAGGRGVSLTVTDVSGCAAATGQTVYANSTVPVGVTATASAGSVCPGSTFTVMANGGGQAFRNDFNYPVDQTWTVNGGWNFINDWGLGYKTPDNSPAYCIVSSNGPTHGSLQPPAFSTTNLTGMKIVLQHFLNVFSNLTAKVQLSVDGSTWVDAVSYTGPRGTYDNMTNDTIAVPSQFENKAKVYLRFQYDDGQGADIYTGWYINFAVMYAGSLSPNWVWTSTTGFTSTSANNNNVAITKTTTFTVTANTGCTASASTTVTAASPPTATIKGDTTVCIASASPNITFSGAGGTAPYTFTYHINTGADKTIATSAGNSVTLAAPTGTAGTFTYYLTNIAGQVCSAAQTGKAAVTIDPLPVATIKSPATACLNATTNVTITASKGVPPFIFSFKKTGNNLSNVVITDSNSYSYSFSPPTSTLGSQQYSLLNAIDAYGCTQNQTGTTTLTVNPLPTLTVGTLNSIRTTATIFGIPYSAVGGANLTYTVTATSPNPMPGFTTKTGTITEGTDTVRLNIARAAAGRYNFSMTLQDNCTSPAVPFTLVVGSNNNDLANLQVDAAALSPAFDAATTLYTTSVSSAVKSITIKPFAADSTATIQVNGATVASGALSGPITLLAGTDTVKIVVTAQDFSTKTYRIAVTKASNIGETGVATDAKIAYSLRRLGGTYLHSAITPPSPVDGFVNSPTPLIRVRRSVDNLLLDIGYTPAGDLDTTTLKSFVGTADGYVAVWYDQSGNNIDAAQTQPAAQPCIALAGVVQRRSGVPTVYFNATSANLVYLATAPVKAFANGFSLFAAAGVAIDAVGRNAMVTKTSMYWPAPWDVRSGTYFTGNGNGLTATTNLATPFVAQTPFSIWAFTAAPNSTAYAYVNGTANGQMVITRQYSDAGTQVMLGTVQDNLTSLNGWLSEAVMFATVVSQADRDSITLDEMTTYLKPSITAVQPSAVGAGNVVKISGPGLAFTKDVKFGSVPAEWFTISNDTVTAKIAMGSTGDVLVTTRFGTATAALTMLPPPGDALNFDGSNDHVTIPNPVSGDFTIEFWMKTVQTGHSGNLWWKGNGIVDGFVQGVANDFGTSLVNSKLCFGIGQAGVMDYSIKSVSNVNTGNWVHVAAVRLKDSGMIKLYINGVLESTAAAGNTDLTAATKLTIGALNTLSGYYKGSLDELRIFNTNRSNYIKTDMLGTLPVLTDGLVSYYNFDAGVPAGNNTGVTGLWDLTPNGNNGTLANFALRDSTSNWVESYAMVVPTIREATEINGGGFTANWKEPSIGVVDNYLLDVSTNASFTSFAAGYNSKPVSGTAGVVSGLLPNTQYYYRVRANKNTVAGQGAYSAADSIKTGSLPTAQITGSQADACQHSAPPHITFTGDGGRQPYTFTYTVNGQTATITTADDRTVQIDVPTDVAKTYTYELKDVTDSFGVRHGQTGSATVAINATDSTTTTKAICAVDLPYNWDGRTYTEAGTYYHNYSNAKGCDSVATLVLTVDDNPDITINNGKLLDSVCYGATHLVHVTGGGPNGPFKYSINGGEFGTDTAFDVPAGFYLVMVKNADGCINSGYITIVQPDSEIHLSLTHTEATCDTAHDGTITAEAHWGFGHYLYSFNNGEYKPENTFTGLSPAVYYVSARDAFDCRYYDTVTIRATDPACPQAALPPVIKTTAATALKINIYPNPTPNVFNLAIAQGDDSKAVEIRVMDMYGRVVYHTTGTIYGLYKFGNTLPSGMYTVQVLNGDKVQTVKLVKGK